MKLLGRALDGMEGGPVFVRMDKLESDKSNIRSLGNIIVFLKMAFSLPETALG